LELVEVVSTGTAEARRALTLSMTDVEDAFQASAALAWSADFIITRNIADYRRSPVKAVTPTDFLKHIK